MSATGTLKKMDLAIKFGNIDALLIKAEEWIKHGKVFNGFRAMLDAGYAISCIELSGRSFCKFEI